MTLTQLVQTEKLSLEEQETTHSIDRQTKVWNIYTSDNRVITKLNKLIKSNPDVYKIIWTNKTGSMVTVPEKYISYRSATKKKEMSEEEKEKKRLIRSERMKETVKKLIANKEKERE